MADTATRASSSSSGSTSSAGSSTTRPLRSCLTSGTARAVALRRAIAAAGRPDPATVACSTRLTASRSASASSSGTSSATSGTRPSCRRAHSARSAPERRNSRSTMPRRLVVFAKSAASGSPSQSHMDVCLPAAGGALTGMHPRTVSIAGVGLLCLAQFVVVLDVTVVAIALPSIREELGFSTASLQWVVSAYTLVFGGLLMLMGRAADLIGRRRLLAVGFALFGGASLACGLASSAGVLLAARAVQGVGAAAISPAALALLTATVPPGPRRTRALGVWTAAAAGGGALGWVLGGVLTEQAGWEWVFLVNVAPCALALLLLPRLLPESRADRASRLDVPGALTVTVGLALLVLGLTRAEQAGIADPSTVGSLAGAAARLAAFARIE